MILKKNNIKDYKFVQNYFWDLKKFIDSKKVIKKIIEIKKLIIHQKKKKKKILIFGKGERSNIKSF